MDPKAYLEQQRPRLIEDLFGWLRIPSISALTEHKPDMVSAADYLVEQLRARGVDKVERRETSANPVVYAEHLRAPGKPTMLIYGHYDVMPVDPVDEWSSPPFEPIVREDVMYGRGTADDKGQVFIQLAAVEALLKSGAPPVNFKLIVEGGEEVGSPGLAEYLEAHKEELACDAVVVSDTSMAGLGKPSLCIGLRGLCYMEVRLDGPSIDLHSGSYGGVVDNPGNAIAHIVASLKDPDGRVLIPGFYDDVRPLSDADRAAIAASAPPDSEYLESTGAPKLHGEPGFTPTERAGARPTLDVNGLWSGFTGEGGKTIIPSKAGAKVSMRLVADQDPDKIADLFVKHVRAVAPDTVRMEIQRSHGGFPYLANPEGAPVQAAVKAMGEVFGQTPLLAREGGSIPIVITLARTLGVDVVLMGFGYPGERSHAPDEHLPLDHFNRGAEAALRFYQIMGS